MLETKGKILLSQIINVILILVAIYENIYSIVIGGGLLSDLISVIITIAALIFALVYTVKGYKKKNIKLFNAFLSMCIVTLLLQLGGEIYYLITVGVSILKSSIISIFSLILDVVLLIIILTVKDLEKKAALTFTGTIIVFTIFNFIRTLTMYKDYPNYLSLTFSAIVLSCIICISVIAKYNNSEEL